MHWMGKVAANKCPHLLPCSWPLSPLLAAHWRIISSTAMWDDRRLPVPVVKALPFVSRWGKSTILLHQYEELSTTQSRAHIVTLFPLKRFFEYASVFTHVNTINFCWLFFPTLIERFARSSGAQSPLEKCLFYSTFHQMHGPRDLTFRVDFQRWPAVGPR